jgi:hypothetical protein
MMNIFVDFVLIKIRIFRGISQFPLGSRPYGSYALTYGPFEHKHVTTTSKR